jgi:hypothetical protein
VYAEENTPEFCLDRFGTPVVAEAVAMLMDNDA